MQHPTPTTPDPTITTTYCICRRILIDTGEADRRDYCVLLSETLERLGARISKVVITHWHHDHLGGLEGVIQHVCKGTYI